jgi:hypothetical protein
MEVLNGIAWDSTAKIIHLGNTVKITDVNFKMGQNQLGDRKKRVLLVV